MDRSHPEPRAIPFPVKKDITQRNVAFVAGDSLGAHDIIQMPRTQQWDGCTPRCGTLWHAVARCVLSRRGSSDGCMYEGRERMGCHAPSLAALLLFLS